MRASWIVTVSTLLGCSALTNVAQAQDKQACNDAYKQAQILRNDHKLVEAREQLHTCSAAACPGFIVKDCNDWLKDDEARIPSVVLSAKNAAGADLTDVRVTMDGAPLATKLEGLSIDVNPGAHTFVFEAADGRAEQKVVVAEGGKAQRVAVVFGGGAGGVAVISTTPGVVAGAGAQPGPSTPAGPSRFSAPVDNGLSFGLRLGYAIPFGGVDGTNGDSVNRQLTGQIPLWLDAGYLFNPYLYAGLYLSYGFGLAANTAIAPVCAMSQVSCSGSDFRIGLDLQYRILGKNAVQPWIGLAALGYESASVSASSGVTGGTGSITVNGIEWVTPQAGIDYKFLPVLSAGLFVAFSLGEYLGISADSNGSPLNTSLGSKALHEWLYFGARTSFDLHI